MKYKITIKGAKELYFYIDIVIFMCFTHYCLFSYDKKKESFTFKTTRKINTLNQSIYQLYAELRRKSDELIQLQNTQYSSVKMQVEYENVQKEVDSLRSRLFELRESKILNSNLAKK